MIFRVATSADIPGIQIVRNAVKENPLPYPSYVTYADCEEFMTTRGKGWVCEINSEIVGFAIADLKENNIWALFIHPEHEGIGIGKRLHQMMLDWYFDQQKNSVWLGTAPNTRAESFYRKAGWRETGVRPNGEIRFEMTRDEWAKKR